LSDTRDLSIVAPTSRILSKHIVDQLRQAIVVEQLKPGQHIVEKEIAERMQTSRGPVRDALLLLENEGLVVRYPNRGAFVAELDTRDAKEVYSLRQSIEALAIEWLLERNEPPDLCELDDLVQKMEAMVDEEYDLAEVTELDMAFHRALCRISGHRRALVAWEALSGQTRLLLLIHRRRNPRDFVERGARWHRRLVEAIRQQDPERAKEELKKHTAAALETYLETPE
jgi:DNA-binding GntR family transcriptional regulator